MQATQETEKRNIRDTTHRATTDPVRRGTKKNKEESRSYALRQCGTIMTYYVLKRHEKFATVSKRFRCFRKYSLHTQPVSSWKCAGIIQIPQAINATETLWESRDICDNNYFWVKKGLGTFDGVP